MLLNSNEVLYGSSSMKNGKCVCMARKNYVCMYVCMYMLATKGYLNISASNDSQLYQAGS